MRLVRRLTFLGALALVAAVPAVPSSADSHGFRLHIQGRLGSDHPVIDLDVPWESDKDGSPFKFTGDECGDVGVERLRHAWTALRKMPEGQTVTIETRSESILASRVGGYLVLEPRHRGDRDNHHARVKIPDYIVDAILDHDGRLTDADLERLVRERGKVTLVKMNSDVGGGVVWLDRAPEPSD